MNNKNFNNNDNESFMEGIYGCLERIETGIIKKIEPNIFKTIKNIITISGR